MESDDLDGGLWTTVDQVLVLLVEDLAQSAV